jgi:hypothetical protein
MSFGIREFLRVLGLWRSGDIFGSDYSVNPVVSFR